MPDHTHRDVGLGLGLDIDLQLGLLCGSVGHAKGVGLSRTVSDPLIERVQGGGRVWRMTHLGLVVSFPLLLEGDTGVEGVHQTDGVELWLDTLHGSTQKRGRSSHCDSITQVSI